MEVAGAIRSLSHKKPIVRLMENGRTSTISMRQPAHSIADSPPKARLQTSSPHARAFAFALAISLLLWLLVYLCKLFLAFAGASYRLQATGYRLQHSRLPLRFLFHPLPHFALPMLFLPQASTHKQAKHLAVESTQASKRQAQSGLSAFCGHDIVWSGRYSVAFPASPTPSDPCHIKCPEIYMYVVYVVDGL